MRRNFDFDIQDRARFCDIFFNRRKRRPIQKRRIMREIIGNRDIILERPFHIVVYEIKLRYDSGFAKSSNYVYGWCVPTELVHTGLRIAN